MNIKDRLKKGMKERDRKDIEATIKMLKGRLGKLYSFMLFWYPFQGSVEDHIHYLENQLDG